MPVKHEDDARINALSIYRPPRDPYIGAMPWDRWRRRWKMVAKFYRWQIRMLQERNRRLAEENTRLQESR